MVSYEMLKGTKNEVQLQVETPKDGLLNFSLTDFVFQLMPQSGGGRPPSSGGRPLSSGGRSPSRQQMHMMS